MNRVTATLRAALVALLVASVCAPVLAAEPATLQGVVNVNTASLEELQILPGVGEARARAIVETRRARGGFKRVEDLVEVKGIGETLLERIRPFVSIQGKTTAQVR